MVVGRNLFDLLLDIQQHEENHTSNGMKNRTCYCKTYDWLILTITESLIVSCNFRNFVSFVLSSNVQVTNKIIVKKKYFMSKIMFLL